VSFFPGQCFRECSANVLELIVKVDPAADEQQGDQDGKSQPEKLNETHAFGF
jgi:hypothetical protein